MVTQKLGCFAEAETQNSHGHGDGPALSLLALNEVTVVRQSSHLGETSPHSASHPVYNNPYLNGALLV